MVSRYVKQKQGRQNCRCMQTEGNFGGEQGFAHKTAQSVFSMFHCPKDDFSTHLVPCLQSLYTDLENIWAGHFKLLASIHRYSTQLYLEGLMDI